jgi:Protein of unknown function (DUF4239)
MDHWLHSLSVIWLTLVVFAATALVTGLIYGAIRMLAANGRTGAFKAVSPGMLPPLGLLFGLLVGFLAAQVWGDSDRARMAVNREASALRTVSLLATSFPGESEAQIHALLRRHIEDAITLEWPAMALHRATLTPIPAPLAEAVRVTLSLAPQEDGQRIAQREIVTMLQDALDARRQRIIISQSGINWVKWVGVILEAILTLIAIACVHSESRGTSAIALAIFAAAVAVSLVLIASQERPFTGSLSVGAETLHQVMPPP